MQTSISKTANATFGHLARTGTVAISDALSDVIENAPPEPQARAEYIERVASAEYAERYLGRAYERLLAAGEAAQPHLGKPLSVEYAEAANAADLLIAADLLMALMLKPALRRTDKMTHVLNVFIPSGRPTAGGGDHVFEVVGKVDEVLAILALRNGIEPVTQTALAAWHSEVLGGSFAAHEGEGFLADLAIVRQELFETYLDRDTELDAENPPSSGTIMAATYATIFAGELQIRAANRRKRVKLS